MAKRRVGDGVVPEKIEQQRIVQHLRALGAAVYILGHPSPADGRRFRGTGQTPGVPDLYAMVPRAKCERAMMVPVWVEVKRKGGAVRPAQQVFREQCLDSGHAHVLGTHADVCAWLETLGYAR